MKDFICEVCGSLEFYEFNYPVYVAPLKKKIFLGALRRYFVNPLKFFSRFVFYFLPKDVLPEWRKRALDPYKQLQSFGEVFYTLQKIDQATELFNGRKILICKKCDLGTVYPRISETELIQYYKKDYWVANLGELEPAESNRTIITYRLLKDNVGFDFIKSVIEFGSASAHLSRYIKSKEPSVQFDAVDPGILWRDVLKRELIREVYTDVGDIDTKYDLLISSHALEHVSSLIDYFIKFRDLLTEGGYLYFEVPNSEERDLIFDGRSDYHIPHTYFFSPKSFDAIAAKFGFQVIFNNTFSRSYRERFSGIREQIGSMDENPQGAYLRVLLRKKG